MVAKFLIYSGNYNSLIWVANAFALANNDTAIVYCTGGSQSTISAQKMLFDSTGTWQSTVAWPACGSSYSDDGSSIVFQKGDSSSLNLYNNNGQLTNTIAVTMASRGGSGDVWKLADGGITIIWSNNVGVVSNVDGYVLMTQHYSADLVSHPATAVTPNYLHSWTSHQLSNGDIVVAWSQISAVSGWDGIRAALIDTSTNTIGSSFQVSTGGGQGPGSIVSLGSNFALIYFDGTTTLAQIYDQYTNPIGSPISSPIALGSGIIDSRQDKILVISSPQSGAQYLNIYAQYFDLNLNALGGAKLIATADTYTQFNYWDGVFLNDGSVFLAWHELVNCGGNICSDITYAFRISANLDPIGLNHPPASGAVHIGLPEGNYTLIDVLSAATDADGDTLNMIELGTPMRGTAVVQAAKILYHAVDYYYGNDAFNYTISDGRGGSVVGQVTIQISHVNHPPFAVAANYTVYNNVASNLNVLASDYDLDVGDTLTISSVTAANHGSAVIQSNKISYTATGGYRGSDGFNYTISDNHGAKASTSVILTVKGPVTASPINTNVNEEGALQVDVLASAGNPNGDTLTIASLGTPAHGTAVVQSGKALYTPTPYYVGLDSFSYTVTDGTGGTASSSVVVTVLHVNHPPVASDATIYTNINTSASIDVITGATDIDGDVITIDDVSPPSHGQAMIQASNILYTPANAFHGSDSFSYTIIDGNGGNATALVTINVLLYPIALAASVTLNENDNQLISVMAGSSDPNGLTLSLSALTNPGHGTASIQGSQALYTPTLYYFGSDSFNYTLTNGYGNVSAVVSITVNRINLPPFVANITLTTPVGVGVLVDALAQAIDYNGASMSIHSVGSASHGTASIGSGKISYVPNSAYHGQDSFNYTIQDNVAQQNTGQVYIYLNSPPVAGTVTTQVTKNQAQLINVLSNGSDPDGDTLSITAVTAPLHGTASISGNEVLYTPNADYVGGDSFIYTITDSYPNSSANATVSLAVSVPVTPTTPSPATATPTSATPTVAPSATPTPTSTVESFVSSAAGIATIVGSTIGAIAAIVGIVFAVKKHYMTKKLMAKLDDSLSTESKLATAAVALELLPARAEAYRVYEELETAARMETSSWFASLGYEDDIFHSGLHGVNLLGNSTIEGELGV